MNHILPPADQPPRRPSSSSLGVIALTVGLLVSLLLNGTLGVLYQDERARVRALEAQVEEQQRSIDDLRTKLGSSDATDPIDAIAEVVARLRGLGFKETVEPDILTAAGLQERVRSLFREGNSRDEFDATQRVLEVLGVIEAGAPLWDRFVAAHEEQVAGFYDSKEGALVVAGGDAADPSPFTRVVLAHELTHALTDQHFDLGRLDRLRDRGRDDAASAYLALVEGDATVLMLEYLRTGLNGDEQAAATLEQGAASTEAFGRLPRFIQEGLLFPYTAGVAFAEALRARGGLALVDRAYEDPPSSTEQILHPERYMDRRDDPVEVNMPALRRALGAGWRRSIDGEIGELDLRMIADIQIASGGLSARDAARAAEGWDGGAYQALSSSDGTLVAILTEWDSVSEAREALELFQRWLPARFGNRGAQMEVSGSGRGWLAEDGAAGIVARDGTRLIIVLGPSEEPVRNARAAFGGV